MIRVVLLGCRSRESVAAVRYTIPWATRVRTTTESVAADSTTPSQRPNSPLQSYANAPGWTSREGLAMPGPILELITTG
jgi:hypothetical protein